MLLLLLPFILDLHYSHCYLSLSVTKTIAKALINCRLDYYNCLPSNTTLKNIAKLQCVQNLTRVVTQSPQFSHSVPLLKSLPVQSCIIFKLCTTAYQILSSGEPSYLFYKLSLAPKPREFHSSGFHVLSVPRVKLMLGLVHFELLSLLFGTDSLIMLSHQIA